MNEIIFKGEVSDAFWGLVEPLIPRLERDKTKDYQRKLGGGRKPMPLRRIFEAICFVLRTRCKWQEIPKSIFGSPSAIHKHYIQWLRAGFFESIWKAGLAEHEEMAGVPWCWDRTESSEIGGAESETGSERSGNTVKKRRKSSSHAAGLRKWRPAVDIRNRERNQRHDDQQKKGA